LRRKKGNLARGIVTEKRAAIRENCAHVLQCKFDQKQLFVLTEINYKCIDGRSLPVLK